MSIASKILAAAVFLIVVLVLTPLAINATHRTDLYYTLSSVALLAIASGGVWLTSPSGASISARGRSR